MSRRFSEQEAQRIFARVAERQRAAAPSQEGLSLEDLEEAARAAGLDPRLIAQAALEIDAPSPTRKTILGAPTEVSSSRLILADLDDAVWARMVLAARSDLGATGISGQIGDLREWTAISGGTKNGITTRLSAEPTPDGTRLTLTRSAREAVLGAAIASSVMIAMSAIFGTLAAVGVDPELWIPFGIMLAFGGGFLLTGQIGSRIWEKRQARRFESLLDRMELASAPVRGSDRANATEPEAKEKPRLQIPELEDELESEASASRTRLRE